MVPTSSRSPFGLYWLASRPDEDTDWCRAGVIECVTLVDEDEENLISELETVTRADQGFDLEPDPVSGDRPERDGGHAHDAEKPPRISRDPRAATVGISPDQTRWPSDAAELVGIRQKIGQWICRRNCVPAFGRRGHCRPYNGHDVPAFGRRPRSIPDGEP